jgi:pilus assembly protein FimV
LSAEQRKVVLEQNLHDLRADAASDRAAMDRMRLRLGQADEQNRWLWALLALAVGLASMIIWLRLRLRALQLELQAGRRQGAAAAPEAETVPSHAPAAGVPLVDPSILPGAGAPTPAHADAPARPSRLVAHRADLPAPSTLSEAMLTRAHSVDELIDLEQQAEFFLVLGEQDAAIELLRTHLRGSSGVSPWPYLKLLEIYRRRRDRESYERMRQGFERRFNAVAPDWDSDPERGRDLQHYPAVLAALQQAWHSPLDAMAELENLLLRKRRGELFELPAYRDLLTLFAVARDLQRQLEDRPAAGVDVLLPLHLGRDPQSAPVPSIFDRLEHSSAGTDLNVENRATAPIDLDLSDPAHAPRRRSATLTPVVVPLRRGRG